MRPAWHTFEVSTRVEIVSPGGVSRAWIPIPPAAGIDWQRRAERVVIRGNAETRVVDGPGPSHVVATWVDDEPAPGVEVVVRVATRARAPGEQVAPATAADRAEALVPSRWIRTDGIVSTTAARVSAGAASDLERARRIYDWVVDNTFRDPAVRGCGPGDVCALLESRRLGGKCADLNGLFVGLARAAGVPAREWYGLRLGTETPVGSGARDVTRFQHCRAEFHADGAGWVSVDPSDVRKFVLDQGDPPLDDPRVQRVREELFGSAPANWIAYNHAHDVRLPDAPGPALPYFLVPAVHTGGAWRDALDPERVAYAITARPVEGGE